MLEIESNVAVTSMQGLEGVTNIAGSLKIFMNTVLAALQGLDGLRQLVVMCAFVETAC